MKSRTLAEALGAGVRAHRERKEWTQEELARRVRRVGLNSWTRPTIAAVELGARKASISELLALVIALQTSLSALLEDAPSTLLLAESVEFPTDEIRSLLQGEQIEYEPTGGSGGVESQDPRPWRTLVTWLLEVARSDGQSLSPAKASGQPTLRLAWRDLLLTLGIQPSRALRRPDDRPAKQPPGVQELLGSVAAEATGDFERYVGTRLDIRPEAVAFLSRLIWRKTAADYREEKAKEEGISRHRAGRYVIQDLSRMLSEDPDGVFETSSEGLALAPPSAVGDMAMKINNRSVTGKYGPLFDFLRAADDVEVTVDFQAIEEILGEPLPSSAANHRAWWANDLSHTQGNAWLSAGWKVDSVDLLSKRVIFRREED